VITQGAMILKGDKIIVVQYPEGGIQKIIASGQPAYFKDIMDAQQPPTIAYGNLMEYHDLKRTLTIKGKAKVLRGEDQFIGHKIHYLLDESKLAAEGGQSHQGEDERIEMIIQPRNIEQ
jgi:lipopolysaccharide export system protein LptA